MDDGAYGRCTGDLKQTLNVKKTLHKRRHSWNQTQTDDEIANIAQRNAIPTNSRTEHKPGNKIDTVWWGVVSSVDCWRKDGSMNVTMGYDVSRRWQQCIRKWCISTNTHDPWGAFVMSVLGMWVDGWLRKCRDCLSVLRVKNAQKFCFRFTTKTMV